jgi:hypothetical protein
VGTLVAFTTGVLAAVLSIDDTIGCCASWENSLCMS